MAEATEGRAYYETLLEKIRLGFPSPVSNPIHDAYVGWTVMKVLERLDAMKGSGPFLGRIADNDYSRARQASLDPGMRSIEELIDLLVPYAEGYDLWAHPLQQMNVVPPVSLPALLGNLVTGLLNPSLDWDEFCRRFAEVEVEVSALVADLIGYDQERAVGISTYGGSGAVLYGIKMMLAKALPDSSENGVREDVKIVVSEVSHSCKYNALDWLGIGRKNLVTVPTDVDNCLLPEEMMAATRALLDAGQKLGGFLVTMGTTDAFAIDDIGFVAGLRDRLVAEYRLPYRPHIHADAVIGWPYTVFREYDFEQNPLGFPPATLDTVLHTQVAMDPMRLADSVGIDFHKTGYTQYISTLFLLKERDDLRYISRNREAAPYMFQTGEYHPGLYTLELSRAASGVFSALANLRFLGRDGLRVLLIHPIEMATILRRCLATEPTAVCLNRFNYGSVTLFRMYPRGVDAKAAFARESTEPGAADALLRHNEFNRRLYLRIREESRLGRCAALSLTDCFRRTAAGHPIAALKSFIMTPFVEESTMTGLLPTILRLRDELDVDI